MNIDKKTCINIGIVAFLLYLAIHYWDGLVGHPLSGGGGNAD